MRQIFAVTVGLMALIFAISGPAAARPLFLQPPVAPLRIIRVASAQQGQQLFQSHCAMCHTVQAGAPNKFGPNLHGVVGRRAGSLPGYNYSPAMKHAGAYGLIWSAATLDRYLENPHRAVPGDKMPFPGLPSAADRAAIIAFLSTQ